MRLVNIDDVLEDSAFCTEFEETFEPDPLSGEMLEPISRQTKKFYRELLEDEALGVSETIKVALVQKINGKYEIVRILE